ncbi:hypothetical protein ACWIGW_38745 [Nocardia brasiliensis]
MDASRDDGLRRDLWADSPVEKVVRGHLWIESGLISLIEATFRFPDLVDLGRFSFVQKLALVAGYGFIRPENLPAYRRFNAVRNKVAHDLSQELTEQDLLDLVNAFGDEQRDVYEKHAATLDDPAWQARFSLAILHLYLRLEIEHTRFKEHEARVAKTNREIQGLVDDLRKHLKDHPSVRAIWDSLGGPPID